MTLAVVRPDQVRTRVPSAARAPTASPPRLGPVATVLGQVTIVGNVIMALNVFQLRPSFFTVMAVPALGCVALAPPRAVRHLRVSIPVMLLLAWMVLSLGWSIGPSLTFFALRVSIAPLLGLAAVAALLPTRDILAALRLTVWLVIVAQIAALLLDPAGSMRFGGEGVTGWKGTFIAKNTFAAFLAMALAIVLPTERGVRRLLLVGALVVLLVGAKSVTAQGAALLVAVAWPWLAVLRRGQGRNRPALVLMSVAMAVAMGVAMYLSFNSVVTVAGKDPTLTGRTAVWEASWDVISERPVLGYGLNAFINVREPTPPTREIWSTLVFRPPHAHNGALDAVGQIGLVGLGLIVAAVSSTIVAAARSLRAEPLAATVILLLVLVQLVFSVAEPFLLGNGWLVVLVLTRSWSLQLRPVTARRPVRSLDHPATTTNGAVL